MSVGDDPQAVLDRIHALWLLLRPTIEDKAQELGASPLEMALALTIGTPTYVFAAVRPEAQRESLIEASSLFAETCATLAKQGEH